MAETSLDAFKAKDTRSWRTGWKAKACTGFALYLKVFKNHLYYLCQVRVLSIKPCLHTQLPEHNRSYWKVSRDWGIDHLEWTYNGAFEQLFDLGRGEFEEKFSKNSNAWGIARVGGMVKLRFDWYITLLIWMISTVLNLLIYSLTGNRNFARKEGLIYETIAALTMPVILDDNTCAVLPSDIYGAKIPFPWCTVIT